MFDEREPRDRIARGDAQYVECIHTNGGLVGFGIGAAICDADFFPNGGSSQPGCLSEYKKAFHILRVSVMTILIDRIANFLANTCSHLRVVELYAESLLRNEFWANQCESTRRMSRQNCRGQPGAFMGGSPASVGARGIFYLDTNRRAPFGQGRW